MKGVVFNSREGEAMKTTMRRTLQIITVVSLLPVLTGCGIFGPRDRVIVTGTVYLDGEPAADLAVVLSVLPISTCDLAVVCLGAQRIGDDDTDADGTYRIEVEPRSCGGFSVVVSGYETMRIVQGCGTHTHDFRLESP